MTPEPTRQETPVTVLRTDDELRFIAFQMATKYLMQKPPKEHPLTKMIEEVLIKMRDECDAERATLHARVAFLERQLSYVVAENLALVGELDGDDDDD